MKTIFNLLLAVTTVSCFPLSAQINIEDIGPSSIEFQRELPGSPFKIDISADYVGRAKVEKCSHIGHVTFATGQVEFNYVFYHQDCYHEGASIAVTYDRTFLDWTKNFYFTQQNYDTIGLILSAFTERLENWQWLAQISSSFDNIPHWSFPDYMYYDILMWGRYSCIHDIGLHIGFLAQTGMKFDRVYPIIGIDWTYDCHWKFNAVFPVDISVVYTINSAWNVAVAGRFIDQRHRAKRDQILSEAIWHYQTTGAELAINYTPTDTISANLHAGYSFGGHLSISNRRYRRYERLSIESAPYAGGELVWNF